MNGFWAIHSGSEVFSRVVCGFGPLCHPAQDDGTGEKQARNAADLLAVWGWRFLLDDPHHKCKGDKREGPKYILGKVYLTFRRLCVPLCIGTHECCAWDISPWGMSRHQSVFFPPNNGVLPLEVPVPGLLKHLSSCCLPYPTAWGGPVHLERAGQPVFIFFLPPPLFSSFLFFLLPPSFWDATPNTGTLCPSFFSPPKPGC